VFSTAGAIAHDGGMTTTAPISTPRAELWRELAQQLRVDSIRATAVTRSGHPTSAMSAADLMAVLLEKYLHYDFDRPCEPNNDHLIFSKGHASPLLYALYKAAGAISDEELLTLRLFGSRLEGHPSPALPWVDVATGSLGFGLPVGAGIALAAKRLDPRPYRVWVLCGDSEMAEGSVWEALEHAAFWKLDNLTVIVDVNRLGQTGETMHGWDVASYVERARAFGWHALAIDGHDPAEIDLAYAQAIGVEGRPTLIAARTVKGKGVAAVEDRSGWHGKAMNDAEAAVAELGGTRSIRVTVTRPEPAEVRASVCKRPVLPRYSVGDEVATRHAYGEALVAVGQAYGDVVAMDGEVSNSTGAGVFAEANPHRFFEMYVAEQQMIAAAVGLQVVGWRPYASAFAAFFSRAYDFVRMAAVSRANIRICGSHAGVATGEDGPSQMALEDLAMFRAVHGSTVLYPSDANQTAALVATMAELEGIVYLRTTRAATPVLYHAGESFPVGGSRTLRRSDHDNVTLVAAGITVHEALRAARLLESRGVRARVIDAYSVKPIDADSLRAAAEATEGRFIVAEDHWPEGGLGDAVLSALADVHRSLSVVKLAPTAMPGSGRPDELLAAAGIDAESIADAADRLCTTSWSSNGSDRGWPPAPRRAA
jgi:transketolase